MRLSAAGRQRETIPQRFGWLVSVMFLGLIALLQGLRFSLAWEVTINGLVIPIWFSAVACLISGGLALLLWRAGKHRQ